MTTVNAAHAATETLREFSTDAEWLDAAREFVVCRDEGRVITVTRKLQPDGSSLWAVQSSDMMMLSKSGRWSRITAPSATTDKWYARHRWPTKEEALAFFVKMVTATSRE